jgi:hypothetical protein
MTLYEYTERWRDYHISQARGAKDLERPMYNSALRRETVADEKPDPQTNEILEDLTNLWIEQQNAEIEKSLT